MKVFGASNMKQLSILLNFSHFPIISTFFQESLKNGGVKEWSVKLNKSFQEVELKALLFVV